MASKTATVLIRLTPDDRARLQRVADANFLEAATWARQAVLRMLQDAERTLPPPPATRKAEAPRRGRRTP